MLETKTVLSALLITLENYQQVIRDLSASREEDQRKRDQIASQITSLQTDLGEIAERL